MTNQALSDRELLEYAAKAVGLEVADPAMSAIFLERWPLQAEGLHIRLIHDEYLYWNPLLSDADAFRLSVNLRLPIKHITNPRWEPCRVAVDNIVEDVFLDEVLAATRRAIVRAAAEIGRGLEQPLPKGDVPYDDDWIGYDADEYSEL